MKARLLPNHMIARLSLILKQTEVLAILCPGTFMSSGLEVDEAQGVLRAVLGLSSEEQVQFFSLSHTEDRDDIKMRSPPHKKTRCHL